MSHSSDDAQTSRPPTTADATPQAAELSSPASIAIDDAPSRFAGLTISPSALRGYTLILALVVVWGIFAYATDGTFLTARNFSNLMRQTAITGTLAVGMLMVIVAGQIDLSIGSVVGLTGGIAALMQAAGYDFVTSISVGIAAGLAIGFVQGGLVAYANIPAFIVTLGGLLGWRGVVKGITEGSTIPINSPAFKSIGQQYLDFRAGYGILALALLAIIYFALRRQRAQATYSATTPDAFALVTGIAVPSIAVAAFIYYLNSYAGLPIPVVILLVVALAGAFITQNTTFGRYLYAIGGNPDAARLSGISLRGHTLAVFCIIGALAGVAGMVYTARVGAASPDAGTLLELDAIAACVIGGASLMGGRGTILGACLGALFMASLDNGMSLEDVDDYVQDIVKGAILVTAVGLDMLGRRRG